MVRRYSLEECRQRIRYAKDAHGHEHDEEGRFTGPGSGEAKPKEPKEKKPSDKATPESVAEKLEAIKSHFVSRAQKFSPGKGERPSVLEEHENIRQQVKEAIGNASVHAVAKAFGLSVRFPSTEKALKEIEMRIIRHVGSADRVHAQADGAPLRYSLADCRAAIARYQFSEHQHPRARDGTFMARGQGRDRGGPEGKIFDAPPKGGPEAKVFDPPAAKQTTTDAPAKTEVKPELPPGPGEFGHSSRPNAAPMQPLAPAAPAMSKPPKPGFQERRAKLQERAKKKEAEFEGMTDEERTAHKAERDAKAMVHNARKAKKPAGFIQQLMSHWLGAKNALGAAKKAAKAKKVAPAPTTQPAASQTPTEVPQADANPFAGFHETNIQDRMWDIAEGRHLRHQVDGQPVRYMKDASGHEHDEKGLFTGSGGGSSKLVDMAKNGHPRDWSEEGIKSLIAGLSAQEAQQVAESIGMKGKVSKKALESRYLDRFHTFHKMDRIGDDPMALPLEEGQRQAAEREKNRLARKAEKASADGRPARYSAAECHIRLAMSRRRLLPACVRG